MAKSHQRATPLSPRERALGKAVDVLRRAQGLSQAKLAERAGLASETIGRLERGTFSPTVGTLHKIADGLGLTLLVLVMAAQIAEHSGPRALHELIVELSPGDQARSLEVIALLHHMTPHLRDHD